MERERESDRVMEYHELDVKKSLRENLMFKTVVEYPELYVVLKEHCEEYLARFPGEAPQASPCSRFTPSLIPPRCSGGAHGGGCFRLLGDISLQLHSISVGREALSCLTRAAAALLRLRVAL
ncbi:hypothetical protein NFI96_007127 [Prochilodus magdalenae]|nr:hypothetical protein NFI96_007127 [Prochilodus magdalenae]